MHPLIELWNARCGALPKVRVETPDRTRLIEKAMKACPDMDKWAEAIDRIAASAYCNGINDSGWRASFRFLLNERTLANALEGVYDDRSCMSKTPTSAPRDAPWTPPEWFCRRVLTPYNRKHELSVVQKKWLDAYLLHEPIPDEMPEEMEGK